MNGSSRMRSGQVTACRPARSTIDEPGCRPVVCVARGLPGGNNAPCPPSIRILALIPVPILPDPGHLGIANRSASSPCAMPTRSVHAPSFPNTWSMRTSVRLSLSADESKRLSRRFPAKTYAGSIPSRYRAGNQEADQVASIGHLRQGRSATLQPFVRTQIVFDPPRSWPTTLGSSCLPMRTAVRPDSTCTSQTCAPSDRNRLCVSPSLVTVIAIHTAGLHTHQGVGSALDDLHCRPAGPHDFA